MSLPTYGKTSSSNTAAPKEHDRAALFDRIYAEFVEYTRKTVEIVKSEANRFVYCTKQRGDDYKFKLAGFHDVIYWDRFGSRPTYTNTNLNPEHFAKFIQWEDGQSCVFRTLDELNTGSHVATWEQLSVFTDLDILRVCQSIKFNPKAITDNVAIVQAAPGCGKTHEIIESFVEKSKGKYNYSEMGILTSTREGKIDLVDRLCKRTKIPQKKVKFVHTIDSYIMNSDNRYKYLLIDEAMMQHPGKILLAIFKAQPDLVRLYGDVRQVPFINRLGSDFKCIYPEVGKLFKVVKVLYISYRCPADVCYVLRDTYMSINAIFDIYTGMISVSKKHSTMKLKQFTSISAIPKVAQDTVYLTFKQSEAQELKNAGFKNVNTIHEFQGKQSKHVVIVRTSYIDDNIYKSESHITAAISRHTDSLTYYHTVTAGDELVALIEKSRSASLVMGLHAGGIICENDVDVIRPGYEQVSVPVSKNSTYPFMDKRAVLIKRGKTGGRSHVYYHTKQGDFLYLSDNTARSYSEFVEFFKQVDFSGKNVYVFGDIFPGSNSNSVKLLMRYTKANKIFFKDWQNPIISSAVSAFGTRNAITTGILSDQREKVFLTVEEPENLKYRLDPQLAVFMIQQFIAACTPDVFYVDQSMDIDIMENQGFELHINSSNKALRTIINFQMGLPKPPTFDNMRPVIKSSCYYPQRVTLMNTLHAIEKRNANVSKLTGLYSHDVVLGVMKDNFSRVFPDTDYSNIDFNLSNVQEWLDRQPPTTYSQLASSDECVFTLNMSLYEFHLKPNPKPDLTNQALDDYPRPQTILYQCKDINALFCPIWNNIMKRLLSGLGDKFLINTCMSDTEFADLFTHRFPPSSAKLYKALEIDMKRYDKSQGELALDIELYILRKFGVDEAIVNLWDKAHRITRFIVRSKNPEGIMMKQDLIFQRKTGDGATYPGNTILLMLMLVDSLPIENVAFMLASGDDSLVFIDPSFEVGDFADLSRKFNLEAKCFYFKYHYFCSKFLLDINNTWKMVPDPLKRAIKLGRHDLINEAHLEVYQESLRDNIKEYGDIFIAYVLADAIIERYKVNYDSYIAIIAMYSIVNSKNFKELFYFEPGDQVNKNYLTSTNLDL